MDNKEFVKNVEAIIKDEKVMLIPDYNGKILLLEREGGENTYRVGLFVIASGKHLYVNRQQIAAFSMKDFMLECDRLNLNYKYMLLTMIRDLVDSLA
ncbi:hypothetical protein [Anaerocolumna aminovalerica]|uniref:hypothetical protein n=1 Tax=Anaerocolumna aminovalerica TaxID=1527 RepID=UPI000BE2B64A|nr:hypothetical protein [Anaerocolumna aminovalerica]